jgi:acetyl esterase/lipase
MREVKVDPTFPVERLEGIEFACPEDRPLLLDAVYPAAALHGDSEGPRPVVLHVGEPWVEGVRSTDPWYHAYFATHGFFAASCDVRSFAEAPFPAQLHDVKAALRWLRANASTYGIDVDHIGVWGESIAATLAALAGLTGDCAVPELEGDSAPAGYAAYSTAVQAVLWASGGADFPRHWAEKP